MHSTFSPSELPLANTTPSERCSRLHHFKRSEKIICALKTRYAIRCVVNFYSVGAETQGLALG
jgi:hypothetical protein